MSEPTLGVEISNESKVKVTAKFTENGTQKEVDIKASESVTFSLQEPTVNISADKDKITVLLMGSKELVPIEQAGVCVCISCDTSVGLQLDRSIHLILNTAWFAGPEHLTGLRCGEGEPPPTA